MREGGSGGRREGGRGGGGGGGGGGGREEGRDTVRTCLKKDSLCSVPSIKEYTRHIEGVMSNKHVAFHPYLENGGWGYRLHQGNQECFTSLESEMSTCVYHLIEKGGREGGGGRQRRGGRGGREGCTRRSV